MNQELFKDRKLVIATMHGKERVIAPILERELGVKVILPVGFDSDKYGTFTRDIERAGNQLEAARLKLKVAMEMTGVDLGVSSEGSFGAHPSIPFVQSDFELILFVDAKHGYEIRGHHRTAETNFEGQDITSLEEALVFAKKIGFPEHGVIVRRRKDGRGWIDKTIRTEDQLIETVKRKLARPFTHKLFIETDMRADRNPTRMLAIEQATLDLLKNIRSECPQCAAPGFVCINFEKGLKCSLCGSPTDLPMNDIYSCGQCAYEEKRPVVEFGESADPKYCQYCNP
jgi:hypothetical protein